MLEEETHGGKNHVEGRKVFREVRHLKKEGVEDVGTRT
jgi:hypothetical protein